MSASATCKIAGESGVAGVLRLSQSAAGAPTTIQGDVRGLTPGKHGITVNVSGDLSEGAASTGDIFNPFGAFSVVWVWFFGGCFQGVGLWLLHFQHINATALQNASFSAITCSKSLPA